MRFEKNLVIDGNAVYEVDIECQEKKRRGEKGRRTQYTRNDTAEQRKKPGD